MRRGALRRFGLLAALGLLGARPARSGPIRDWLRERAAARQGGANGDDDDIASHGRGDRGEFELPRAGRVERDLAYGSDAAQRLDVYRPAECQGAVLYMMVHGGGWAHGDKALWRSVKNKATHWVGAGQVLVSVNYRMLPQAAPLEQADDVARALAFVQRHAASWGADPKRVVLVGHSAGAHLVSLLTADDALVERHRVQPWLATISLDSAAFDVESIMRGRHFGLYDKAFGQDPAYWRQASPTHRLVGAPLAPMLIVCSSQRGDSCPQGQRFADKARTFGAQVEVLPLDLSHAQLNDRLGADPIYTAQVEGFLRRSGVA